MQVVRDQSGQYQIEGAEQLQQPGQQYALLPFREGAGAEGALDDLLVGAPVEHVDQQHARKERGERNRLLRAAEAVEHLRLVVLHILETGDQPLAVTGDLQREVDDHETAGQKTDAVQQIGDRDGAQSAEQRVDRTDHADRDHDHVEQRQVAHAGHGAQVEDADQSLRAGVEHDRQQDHHIGGEEDQVRDRTGGAVEAQFEELRHRRDAAFQEAGQEKERHRDQGDHRDHFPRHHAEAVGEGVSVQADHLFGGEVGQQQRTGDEREGQRPPGQKIAFIGFEVVLVGDDPGDQAHQTGEKQEGGRCDPVQTLLRGFRGGSGCGEQVRQL